MPALPKSTAALALVVATAGVTTLVTHHHKRLGASSATLAEVIPLRATRSLERTPLPGRSSSPKPTTPRQRAHLATVDLGYLDTTAYCPTGSRTASGTWPQVGDVAVLNRSIHFGTRLLIAGNVYTVTDWIGHGSDVDLFFDGPDCEQRALDYGRRRLHVVEVGR